MPIKLKNYPEPLSQQSRRVDQPVVLIQSEVAETLKRDLRRYRNGEIDGKSFLIAGHRGAGKTTLVKGAILEVLKEEVGDRRPLMVLLHGPNLFDPAPAPAGADADAPEDGDQPDQPRFKDPVSRALVQIILSTYRSLAEEVVESYRLRLEERRRAHNGINRELFERAAQLEMELDGFPEPDRLRDFWESAGFLYNGVLFKEPTAGVQSPRPPHTDQGLRELVALYTGSLLYQRISGEFKKVETTRTESQGAKQEAGSEASGNAGTGEDGGTLAGVREIVSGVLSLAAGSLAGAATLGNELLPPDLVPIPVQAVVLGLATALAASLVFRFSWSRTRERTLSMNRVFEEDVTRETLDRKVPLLIRRIHNAGLVPVFVVDELDKVEGLSGQIRTLVPHLKKLVAEQGFFCFLTDRTFFERVERNAVKAVYPIEYTYFSDRLFVVFKPEALHGYLETILEVTGTGGTGRPTGTAVEPATGSASRGSSAPGAHPTEGAGAGVDSEEVLDHSVLPYLLLRRSEMHAIDLRRQLSHFAREDGVLDLQPGQVRSSNAFKYDLLLQLAIEMTLADPLLADRIDASPAFARLAIDAMYYPTRLRDQGVEILDLTVRGKSEFRDYLLARMTPDRHRDSLQAQNGDRPPEPPVPDPPAAREDLLNDHEVEILFLADQRLADLLADPFEYLDRLGRWERKREGRLPRSVVDSLPLAEVEGPPLREVWTVDDEGNRSRVYRWAVSDSGTAIANAGRSLAAARADLLYRLAVRTVLARDEVAARDLQRTPSFKLLVNAAIWLPHERWRDDPHAGFFCSGLFRELRRQLRELHPDPRSRRLWSDRILWVLREIASLLTDPEGLVEAAQTSTAWGERFQLVGGKLRRNPALLVTTPDGSGRERPEWRLTYTGEPRFEEESTGKELWETSLDLVHAVGAALQNRWGGSASLGRLQGRYQLIPVSPSWAYVADVALRLEAYRETHEQYEGMDQDKDQVIRMAALLTDESPMIDRALAVGWAVAQGSLAGRPDALERALGAISGATQFEGQTAQQVLEALEVGLAQRWPELTTVLAASPRVTDAASVERWAAWLDRLEADTKLVRPVDPAPLKEAAWRVWLEGKDPMNPQELADRLLTLAVSEGAASLVSTHRAAMTVPDWSALAVRANRGPDPSNPAYVPPEVLPAALESLGLTTASGDAGLPSARLLLVWPVSESGDFTEHLRSWQLPPGTACLVLDQHSLGPSEDSLLGRLRPTHVVFFQPLDPGVVQDTERALARARQSTDVMLLAAVGSRTPPVPGLLAVQDPVGFQDLAPVLGDPFATSAGTVPDPPSPWVLAQLIGRGPADLTGPGGFVNEVLRILLRLAPARDLEAGMEVASTASTAGTLELRIGRRAFTFRLSQAGDRLSVQSGLGRFTLSVKTDGRTLEAHGPGRVLGIPGLRLMVRASLGDASTGDLWITGRGWSKPVAHVTASFGMANVGGEGEAQKTSLA